MQNKGVRVLPGVLLLLAAPTLCQQSHGMGVFSPTPNNRGCHLALSLSPTCPHRVLGCLEGAAAQTWPGSLGIPPAASLPAALCREQRSPQEGWGLQETRALSGGGWGPAQAKGEQDQRNPGSTEPRPSCTVDPNTSAHHLVFLPITSVNKSTSVLRGIPAGTRVPIASIPAP